jgi:ferritin-like metal-binding protein YciE
MAIRTFEDLLVDEIKDLYDAEHQLTKALPKMAKAATSPELKTAFESHLKQTEGHIKRLEQVFEGLGKKPTRKTCAAMKGLVEEGSEVIEEEMDPEVKDAALIGAAQRVEHYEMAGYGTVRTFAHLLGHHDLEAILQSTLEEEGAADHKLTAIASKLNVKAIQQ